MDKYNTVIRRRIIAFILKETFLAVMFLASKCELSSIVFLSLQVTLACTLLAEHLL